MDAREELLLKQYEALRREIENKIAVGEQNVVYGVAATAATWTWFLSQPAGTLAAAAYYLPFATCFLFLIRSFDLRNSIEYLGGHLAEIEQAIGLGRLGWETRLREFRKLPSPGTGATAAGGAVPAGGERPPGPFWHTLFWVLLLLFNLIAAVLQPHAPLKP